MVSPLDKNGGGIAGISETRPAFPGIAGHVFEGGVAQISMDGQHATYVAITSFAGPRGSPGASQYVSARDGDAGWVVHNITTPTNNQAYSIDGLGGPFRAFTPDLSSGLLSGGNGREEGIGVENPPLAPGAPADYENFYLDDIPGGPLQMLMTHAPSRPPGEFAFEFSGSTPNLDHIVLSASAPPEGGEGEGAELQLYEWDRVSGAFQPVSVLPSGVAAGEAGSVLGGFGGSDAEHAISEDGSRVVWTQGLERSLYVREGLGTGHARTVQADAPAGGGVFLTASTDDSKVFFADLNRLTGGSTAGGASGFGDLYMFEPAVGESGRVADLTVDHVDAGGAEVQGVLGASADGSSVYFVANGVLAAGATSGNCSAGISPSGALCNLYLWHEGEVRFIATLSGDDEEGFQRSWLGVANDWSPALGLRTARVSEDGSRAVFMSQEPLRTSNFPEGYDNTVRNGSSCGENTFGNPLPASCEEVFVYEAATDRLTCVSCEPDGTRPVGPSSIPGATSFRVNRAQYQSRVLSEEGEGKALGRVFFDSGDGIVPSDTNGAEDVYEYEAGAPHLISDGRHPQGASFVDASGNGDDVLFVTRAQLVPQDTDQLVDLYDARAPHVPGEAVGFPAPPAPVACEGEDCRAPARAAPGATVPSSLIFAGPGNAAAAAPTSVVKKKPKPKKKHKAKKKAKGSHGKRAKARRTSAGRVGAGHAQAVRSRATGGKGVGV